jgi:hypothetical protein
MCELEKKNTKSIFLEKKTTTTKIDCLFFFLLKNTPRDEKTSEIIKTNSQQTTKET